MFHFFDILTAVSKVREHIEVTSTDFIDLSKIEYRSKEKLYYDNIHLNKKGHEIYADFMSKKINELLAD